MKGKLQALSIQTYGLFDGKKKIFEFEVLDKKIRTEFLDKLQGTEVDFEKDIEPALKGKYGRTY